MGCGSCSNGGCAPAGCGSKGSCASGGCNRLNVFDWLADVDLPWGQREFDIVEVHFKGTRKEYYRNSDLIDLFPGDWVVVEGASGHDVGKVSLKGELVRLQLKRKKIAEDSPSIKKLYRKAAEADIEKLLELRAKEPEIIAKSRNIIKNMKLDMKLGDVEFQADRSKIIFYYTAEERVDFRELIRVLADEFKARIEMKQIGARQEAGRIGGLGVCGLELCCSSWLTDFRTVSTSAARYQNLSLNPAKLAGQCGRLKCCLNYELDTYMDALKDFPTDARTIQTAKGSYELIKTDIFKKQMWYQLQTSRAATPVGDTAPFALMPEKVRELREMNKKGIKPDAIEEHIYVEELETLEEVLDFESVAEGGLDRFDRQGRNKKKKNKNRHNDRRPNRPTVADNRSSAGPQAPQAGTSIPPKQEQTRPPRSDNRPEGGPRPERQGRSPRPDNRPTREDQALTAQNADGAARSSRPENTNRNNNNRNRDRNRNRNNRPRPDRPASDKPAGAE
mgnify:CR=1 FL=1